MRAYLSLTSRDIPARRVMRREKTMLAERAGFEPATRDVVPTAFAPDFKDLSATRSGETSTELRPATAGIEPATSATAALYPCSPACIRGRRSAVGATSGLRELRDSNPHGLAPCANVLPQAFAQAAGPTSVLPRRSTIRSGCSPGLHSANSTTRAGCKKATEFSPWLFPTAPPSRSRPPSGRRPGCPR